MKRVPLALLILAALATARQFAFAEAPVGTPGPRNDPPGPVGPPAPEGSRYEDEPWVLLSVSADGRVLRVQGRGGGCGHAARATATETASTVAIRVQQLVPADPRVVACPGIARIDDMRVQLSAPIDGRALIGQSLRYPEIGLSGRARVPRVVGLRARDARFALRAQGFRVRGLLRGTVRKQRPGPRTPAEPAQTAVTLLGTAPAAVPPLRPVAFRTVAAGGIASSLQRRTGLVVKRETRWRELWRQLTAGDDPSREPPRIAFSRDMLLVVTQGSRPAAAGYRVRIKGVGDTGGSLQVLVTESSPESPCNRSDVSTKPYHVVRIPRSEEPVHFARLAKTLPCDDRQAAQDRAGRP